MRSNRRITPSPTISRMASGTRDLSGWSAELQRRYEEYVHSPVRKPFQLLAPSRQRLLWLRSLGRTVEQITGTEGLGIETQERYWTDVVNHFAGYANRPLSSEQVLELAPSYFAECVTLLDTLDEPFHLPSPNPTRAATWLAFGRFMAALRGAYPAALRSYMNAWSCLKRDREAFEAWRVGDDPAARRPTHGTLHLLGLLAHEIANALAMAGRDREAIDFAARSLECYEALRLPKAKLSVQVGILRAHVVRQQADAYAGKSIEVRSDAKVIDHFVERHDALNDHYGLAKSHHFRALDHWFAGNYPAAIQEAYRSREHADQIDANAWRVQSDGEIASWWGLLFKPGSFLRSVDVAWFIRDFGDYGRRWWQAISSATLADLLACHGHFTRDPSFIVAAQLEYERNRRIAPAAAVPQLGGITSVPSAIGLYEWLTYPPRHPSLSISHDAESYVLDRVGKAETVDLLYYRCLALACLRNTYADSPHHLMKWQRADRQLHQLAEVSGNEYLIKIAENPASFAPLPA